ncbi:MAG: hypothetical protein RIR92_1575 [Pseudomonadota bacterium]|jgi:hypothetical protein
MQLLSFIRSVVAVVWLSGMAVSSAHAEWTELMKDDDITYVWDKASVRAVHVSRIAWTMTILTAKGVKAPNGEEYQSSMARWRVNCKTDSFIKLSESFYAKADGKGREVAFYEAADWRPRDAAIRPGSYLSLLKKQICTSAQS